MVAPSLARQLMDASDSVEARAIIDALDLSLEAKLEAVTLAAVGLGTFARNLIDACNTPAHIARIPAVAEREKFDAIVRSAQM